MREWAKVVLGVLALSVGAGAPTLIVEAMRPGSIAALYPPTPRSGESQREHESYSAQHHADPQDTQNNAAQGPLIRTQQSPGQHAATPQPEEKSHWNTPEGWTAGFTGALFIATAGLWFFTALLWRTTRSAVIEGQQAITAAQSSAEAALRA